MIKNNIDIKQLKEYYDQESAHEMSIRLYKQLECFNCWGIEYFKWFIPYSITRQYKEVYKNDKFIHSIESLIKFFCIENLGPDKINEQDRIILEQVFNETINNLKK